MLEKNLVNIEVIPYKDFKEKLKITKNLHGSITVEDIEGAIMVISIREEK